MIARATAAAAMIVASACSDTSGTPLYGPFPSPMHVTSSAPSAGAAGAPPIVATDGTIKVFFDDFPDPASVRYGAITLSSHNLYYDIDFTSDPVDLVDKALLVRPRSRLIPGAGYALFVAPGSLAALGGGALADGLLLSFAAGDGPSGHPPPTVPSFATDVAPIFGGCAFPGCHAPGEAMGNQPASSPQAHLDLGPDAAYAAIVGVASEEMPSLARVQPGDPSSSYLLRKLVGSRDIRGEKMPIEPAADALMPDQLATLRDWIAGGCPP